MTRASRAPGVSPVGMICAAMISGKPDRSQAAPNPALDFEIKSRRESS
jgi:hypothetical protein